MSEQNKTKTVTLNEENIDKVSGGGNGYYADAEETYPFVEFCEYCDSVRHGHYKPCYTIDSENITNPNCHHSWFPIGGGPTL